MFHCLYCVRILCSQGRIVLVALWAGRILSFRFKMFYQVTCIVGRCMCVFLIFFTDSSLWSILLWLLSSWNTARSLSFHINCSFVWQCTLGFHYIYHLVVILIQIISNNNIFGHQSIHNNTMIKQKQVFINFGKLIKKI